MDEFLSESEIALYESMMKQAEPKSLREVQKEIDFGLPAYPNFMSSYPTYKNTPSVVRRRSENHKKIKFSKLKSSL